MCLEMPYMYIKQIKKPKPCFTLWENTTGIWEHKGSEENMSCISQVFSNVRRLLSQWSNTLLGPLHLLYDREVVWCKTIKDAFSMFHTLIKHVFFVTNQSTHRVLSRVFVWGQRLDISSGRFPFHVRYFDFNIWGNFLVCYYYVFNLEYCN